MRISVAICTYNRSRLLRQTLEGVCRQDFPRDQFEVLVIDNASTDDTEEVVRSFAGAECPPRYVRETRQGLDHARNRAIAESRGEIIIFADDDIVVQTDWITQMHAPFAGYDSDRIGAVGGEVVPVFPDGAPTWITASHRPLAYRRDLGPIPAPQSPMGANFAIPRRVFAALGLFNTTLDRHGDSLFSGGDEEMVRRIRRAGLEVWFSPKARVLHQMPHSRTTFRYAARHAFDSARSRVVDRSRTGKDKAYLASRLIANPPKVLGFALLALVYAVIFRHGDMKKSLVRLWRSCGYVYQSVRCLFGRI